MRRSFLRSASAPETFRKSSTPELTAAILGYSFLRIASGASAVLIGIYLAHLNSTDMHIDARLIGMLGAASFAAELIASIPLGFVADAISPRWLMMSGALLGAVAVGIFALAPAPEIFYFSRILDGLAVAAVTPPLLAYLAQSTTQSSSLRARVMSFFELSLLAGLALGGVLGSQLWPRFHKHAFTLLALLYCASALLLLVGAQRAHAHGARTALHGLKQALRNPQIRALAPVWLCVNAVLGLWLGPTTAYLFTQRRATLQYLDGIFAATPTRMGWMLLAYSVLFGVGVLLWSFVLPHLRIRTAMFLSLGAMPWVCVGLYAVNHSTGWSSGLRALVLAATGLIVMVESGFTPAALAWLAQSLVGSDGKGVAMGIYSVLLGIGAITGSLLAGWLGGRLRIDGLLLGTMMLAILALTLLHWVADNDSSHTHITLEEVHESSRI